jgi:hypothetical protein
MKTELPIHGEPALLGTREPRRAAAPPDYERNCAAAVFDAVTELKHRLEERYERAHPGQVESVRAAIAEAEALAWDLSFPLLFLPDLVEARIAELPPAPVRGEAAFRNAA